MVVIFSLSSGMLFCPVIAPLFCGLTEPTGGAVLLFYIIGFLAAPSTWDMGFSRRFFTLRWGSLAHIYLLYGDT